MATIKDLKINEVLKLAEEKITEEKLAEVMKKLEKEGMDKVKQLQQTTGYIIPPEKGIMNILQSGSDEFEKTMGRPMTYGEMRDMYG
jgi:hypothetical protein